MAGHVLVQMRREGYGRAENGEQFGVPVSKQDGGWMFGNRDLVVKLVLFLYW